jgi:hypothetical protein
LTNHPALGDPQLSLYRVGDHPDFAHDVTDAALDENTAAPTTVAQECSHLVAWNQVRVDENGIGIELTGAQSRYPRQETAKDALNLHPNRLRLNCPMLDLSDI